MKGFLKTCTALILVAMLVIMPATSAYAATVVKPAKTWGAARLYRVNITSGTLNVRSGPGTNYKVLGYCEGIDAISCDGQDSSGTWFHMNETGSQYEGWVARKYLRYVGG